LFQILIPQLHFGDFFNTIDPKRTSGLENRGQSGGIRLDEIFGNEMLCKADVSGND
jgi:hypothetical protein